MDVPHRETDGKPARHLARNPVVAVDDVEMQRVIR